MNKLKIFENPEFGAIRTMEIDGEPLKRNCARRMLPTGAVATIFKCRSFVRS